MRRSLHAVALAALILAPTSILAQDVLPRPLGSTEHLNLTGVGDGVVASWASVYIGPYGGAITSGDPTIPQLTLYCVDYAHDVRVGDNWDVNVSNIGGTGPSLSNTYASLAGLTDPVPLTRYREAAFLASLFDSWSGYTGLTYGTTSSAFGTKQAVYSGIHAAIWRIMSEGGSPAFPYGFSGLNADLAYSMSQPFYSMATAAAKDGFSGSGMSFDDWYVLSDVRGNVDGAGQEYLVRATTVTPEPATWALLLTGLLALWGVSRFRRSKASTSLA